MRATGGALQAASRRVSLSFSTSGIAYRRRPARPDAHRGGPSPIGTARVRNRWVPGQGRARLREGAGDRCRAVGSTALRSNADGRGKEDRPARGPTGEVTDVRLWRGRSASAADGGHRGSVRESGGRDADPVRGPLDGSGGGRPGARLLAPESVVSFDDGERATSVADPMVEVANPPDSRNVVGGVRRLDRSYGRCRRRQATKSAEIVGFAARSVIWSFPPDDVAGEF